MSKLHFAARLRVDVFLRAGMVEGWFEHYCTPDGSILAAERVFRRAKNWETAILRKTKRAVQHGVLAVRIRADNIIVGFFTSDASVEVDGPCGQREIEPLFDGLSGRAESTDKTPRTRD